VLSAAINALTTCAHANHWPAPDTGRSHDYKRIGRNLRPGVQDALLSKAMKFHMPYPSLIWKYEYLAPAINTPDPRLRVRSRSLRDDNIESYTYHEGG